MPDAEDKIEIDIWDAHKDYLRSVLIGMTRDIDLADDLLQETYLRMHDKFYTIRSQNPRAWLVTVARNLFLNHKRSSRPHAPFEDDVQDSGEVWPGSSRHIDLVSLNQAITGLSRSLRSALILRHYGGLNYAEIADQLSCSQTTARQRVWRALCQLRQALLTTKLEAVEMQCCHLNGEKLLDYLYQILSKEEIEGIEGHLSGCLKCKKDVEGLKEIVRSLDVAEHAHKFVRIDELDRDGVPRLYMWACLDNGSDVEVSDWSFTADKEILLEYVRFHGEEISPRVTGETDGQFDYDVHSSTPIEPGESIGLLLVARPRTPLPEYCAQDLGQGRWRYSLKGWPNARMEWLSVVSVRLPEGARMLSTDPPATQVRSGLSTTVLWKKLLTPTEEGREVSRGSQFEGTVEYQL
jgi:RNA polymerase sigma-70 factor (ECF subfamily)